MKTPLVPLALLIVSTGLLVTSCGQATPPASDMRTDSGTTLSAASQRTLGTIEQDGLKFMREEEKVARDVYLELFDTWNIQTFRNIATSEQSHMDAVGRVLEKYGVQDPITDDSRGVFTNPELQALYNQLVEQGKQSIDDALTIGATVEDLDIRDLTNFAQNTENQDLLRLYTNLERGSENHLRAFHKQMEVRGLTYEARYISAEELEEILTPSSGRNE